MAVSEEILSWKNALGISASTNSTNQRSHNTFEDLEGPVLSQIRNHCPKAYAIGPLHEHLKSRLASETTMSQSSNSLWKKTKPAYGSHFLWVMRPDSLPREDREGQTPAELLEGTKKRGLLVSWAPQEEVLAHPAVGAFLTHSGWNSTLKGITAGVPMICWPRFADQQINSRFVSHVWKLGIDMKDTCDRIMIEKMVRNLMEEKRAEFMKSADNAHVS
ncbi:hypothetical protein AAG906_018782 [Vitis piasezkii]